MSATTSHRTVRVRVHATERSTDQELLRPYVATIAALVALVMVGAVAWAAMTPSETADLPIGSGDRGVTAPVSAVRTLDSTEPVMHPDPFAQPSAAVESTAVRVVVSPTM